MIRALHWGIITILLVQILYSGVQVFVVLQPEGTGGPLLGAANDIPFELLVSRRLYAIEAWIAGVGLAIYLGITEVRPRLHPGR